MGARCTWRACWGSRTLMRAGTVSSQQSTTNRAEHAIFDLDTRGADEPRIRESFGISVDQLTRKLSSKNDR
jgi:hypothetical protein